MISRLYLTTILLVAAILWGGLLVIQGVSVEASWIKPLGLVTGVLVLILTVFDRWLWKLSWLQGWFVGVPNLNGTWKGELVSSWIDPKTGQGIAPIEAYLCIRQTFSEVHVRLMTKESASSILSGAFASDNSIKQLVGVYRNVPNVLIRDRSAIHHGGIMLNILVDEKATLDGQYWTDRGSKGSMRFSARSSMHFDAYERAKGGTYW